MTKTELLKKTKAELLKLAKSKFKLTIEKEKTKEDIASAILKAKPEKPKKKSAAKKTPVKKTAKGAVAAKKVKTSAKKSTAAKRSAVAKKTTLKAETKGITDLPLKKPQLPIEQAVSESKYHVAEKQEDLQYTNGLPNTYEDNRIVLFVRDPFWIFTFWDLHPEMPKQRSAEQGLDLASTKTVLRVYDVSNIIFNGSNAHHFYDLEVGSINGSWYLNVTGDNASYLIEIGLKDWSGRFVPMARSNAVTTPRASASSRMDEEWMIADEEFWKIYALSGGFSPIGSSEELSEAMRKRLMESVSSGIHSKSQESAVNKSTN